MKTILIATDFSVASKNAAFYGVKLASLFNARVILLNVYPEVKPSKILPFLQNRKQELRLQSRLNLRNEIRFLNIPEALDVIKRCEEGMPEEVILKVAKEVGANWIIAGMKGISKIELNLFGSTALGLSRTSTIPLILVPEEACFTTPKAI